MDVRVGTQIRGGPSLRVFTYLPLVRHDFWNGKGKRFGRSPKGHGRYVGVLEYLWEFRTWEVGLKDGETKDR